MLIRQRGAATASLVLFFITFLLNAADSKLPPKYAAWLNQEVVYIITDEERKEFLKLTSDSDRDKFIEDFWSVRNPLRGSAQNPYKEEHYKRLEYANQTYGKRSNTPGWKTDMGRTYILFGKPTSHFPVTGYGQIYPLDLWFYPNNTGNPSLPSFFQVLFFIPEDIGEYRFYRPVVDGPMKLVRGSNFKSNADVYKFLKPMGGDIARAPFSLIPSDPMDTTDFTVNMSGEMLLSKIQNFANDSFNVRRIREMRSLKSTVNSWLLTDAGPLDIHSIVLADPTGQYWLDYSVTIPDAAYGKTDGQKLIVRSAFRLLTESGELITEDAEQASFDAFEEQTFRPFEIANRLPLVAGSYRLEVQVSNREGGRTYKGEKKIVVAPNQLSIAGPLLAASVAAVRKPDPNTPFQYFGAQFQPGTARRFSKTGPLRVLYQLQAPSAADYQVEYVVANTQQRDMRRAFTDSIAATEFQNGRLLKSKSIPIADLENGEYRIVLTLRAPGNPAVLASATLPFKIEDGPPEPRLFFLTNVRNLSTRGVATYIRALESVAQKDDVGAATYFRQALEQNPSNTLAARYAVQLYFNGKSFKPITDLYRAMGINPFKAAPETLAQISLSFWQTGDRAQAAEVLTAAREYFPQDQMLAGIAKLEGRR